MFQKSINFVQMFICIVKYNIKEYNKIKKLPVRLLLTGQIFVAAVSLAWTVAK
jgi:hypothetical protein